MVDFLVRLSLLVHVLSSEIVVFTARTNSQASMGYDVSSQSIQSSVYQIVFAIIIFIVVMNNYFLILVLFYRIARIARKLEGLPLLNCGQQ